jgi:hypothetical protein
VKRSALLELLGFADQTMSKPADRRYQRRCADAAVLARRRGWAELAERLEVEALRCHSCRS